MNSSRKFVPAFIKKLDRSLLLNSPSVWSTRIHLALFFSLSFAMSLAAICTLVYKDARLNNHVEILTGFLVLISFIGFVIWLIYLLRFNVFKRFGNWVSGDGVRTFALFFINILVIVAIPFIPMYIESMMANRQYSLQELVSDVNEINIAANKLEYEKLPKEWTSNILKVVKRNFYLDQKTRDTVWQDLVNNNEYQNNVQYCSKRDLVSELANNDSITKVNDSLYYRFKSPGYSYVSIGYYRHSYNKKVFNELDIYNAAVKNYTKPDVLALNKRMDHFKQKYITKEDEEYNQFYSNSKTANYENNHNEYIKNKYGLTYIDNTIGRISGKKDQWYDRLTFSLHFIYWFTITLTLMIFIFRHSTIKTFFLSMLAAVILAIISGVLLAFTNGKESSFFTLLIFYYIIFAIISFTIFSGNTRTAVKGIALNFFLFALPIMPLIVTSFYVEYMQQKVYEGYHLTEDTTHYYLAAEVVGFVLLLILIEPLFKKLYKKWFAAAEE